MQKPMFEDIEKALPYNYYIIRLSTKEIIHTNDQTCDTKGEKLVCFRKLFNKDAACGLVNEKCICQQLVEQNREVEFIVENGEGTDKKYFKAKAVLLEDNMVIATYLDITEQKRVEKELKINSRRLGRAEKLADFGYWEFNIDDKIMFSSKGANKIYGLEQLATPLELVQKIPLPQYRDMLDKSMEDLITRKEPYNVTFRIKHPGTGEIRHVHSIAEFREDKRMVFGVLHDVTETTRTQRALEEILSDLELAQRIANVGNWKFDPDTDHTTWSEHLFSIFEREPEKGPLSLGEYKKIFGREYFEMFVKTFHKAFREGVPFETQLRLEFHHNQVKWIKCICQPEKKPGSKNFLLRGTVQDITSTKKAEVEISNSNKLLRTIIDNIPDAIYMKDNHFRKMIANKGDAFNCGVQDVAEIIGKTDYELFPRDVAEIYTDDDKKVIEKGETIINREEVLPSPDRNRLILTSKFPMRNEENQIVGLVGIGRDITELRERESQLRLFQQTIEQSPLGVVIANPEGGIEYVNPAFSSITGYLSDEVIGNKASMLKSGGHSPEFYQNLWKTISSGLTWQGEFHNKRKDGSMYWESAVITPIFNTKNEIIYFVAMKEDVTGKKQMLEDLKVAKGKAEESDRLKTLFLANLSHEIRTPLNGILGFSNIICSGDADKDKLRFYGNIIENSGKRLLAVIDDIIDISMIQSKQLNIEYNYFSLNELLREIYILYRSQKSNRLTNIEFKVRFCENEECARIYSDKNRIFQILKNLLDNSFKFTESGVIELGCSGPDNNMFVLYVKDTGIGIEESKRDIIFQPFRQAEEGNSRKFDGSGLGLAIVAGITELLSGKISVESETGKGSAFYVTLPVNSIKDETNTEILTEQKEMATKRIVSFEDNKASVEYLNIVMEMLGYEHVNFDNAKKGIEYLRNNRADLVLMDIQMPEMDGYEATRRIKKEFPGLPVIIQTAYAMQSDKEKAFEAGCDDYLSKPLSLKILKEKIVNTVESIEI